LEFDDSINEYFLGKFLENRKFSDKQNLKNHCYMMDIFLIAERKEEDRMEDIEKAFESEAEAITYMENMQNLSLDTRRTRVVRVPFVPTKEKKIFLVLERGIMSVERAVRSFESEEEANSYVLEREKLNPYGSSFRAVPLDYVPKSEKK
jgi:hypothetical protein